MKCPPRNDRPVATLVAKAKSSSTLKTYRFVNGATGATSIAAPRLRSVPATIAAPDLWSQAPTRSSDEVFQREQDKRVAHWQSVIRQDRAGVTRHSATTRAFTPVCDGYGRRVNALKDDLTRPTHFAPNIARPSIP